MKSRTIMKLSAVILAAASAMLLTAGMANAAYVDQFGGWEDIGDPNNADDTGGSLAGSVDHEYSIAQNETSVADWDTFYNDVDNNATLTKTDGGDSGDYDQYVGEVGSRDAPVVNITRNDAAQYANWLTTGDAQEGAYSFSAGDPTLSLDSIDRSYRNADGEVYLLPTKDEFYKAAYYSGSDSYSEYANGVDDIANVPEGTDGDDGWNYTDDGTDIGIQAVGFSSEEQNLTRDMMGNVKELTEDRRMFTGYWGNAEISSTDIDDYSSWGSNDDYYSSHNVGFRVVAIPEPGTAMLLLTAALGIAVSRRRRRD